MLGWIIQNISPNRPPSYETQTLIETAKSMGITLELHAPYNFEIFVNREDKKSILLNNVSTKTPDFILPRMGATTSYFALSVLRHLERMGVYCVNPSESIEIVKDKMYQMQILASSDFPTPKTILAKSQIDIDWIGKKLGFPVVVKAISGSQGSGVFLANDAHYLDDFMGMMAINKQEVNLIFQEFIAFSKGRDLRVFVLGNKVLGAMQRKASEDSFKANYSRGGSVELFPITKEIENLALQITQLFGLEIAGIDLLFDVDGFKVCEVNSSPGFKGFQTATGIDVARDILEYIQTKVG